ncbi:MAG: GNAT family N-acetyltransferase [Bacillota bacterium]
MIRKLAEPDRNIVIQFLATTEFNAFCVGNICNYGFASATVDSWGDFSQSGQLLAVLQRYEKFFVISAAADYDSRKILTILQQHRDYESVSGREEFMQQLAVSLGSELQVKRYMQLSSEQHSVQQTAIAVEAATLEDSTLIDDLLVSVEFGFCPGEIVERYQRTLAKGEARYFIVKQDGKIVACAATAAECAQSAVIVSVCCRAEYRRQGLAEACMRELCRTLTGEGKQLYLFYENPLAGKLYEKLGFVTIGEWAMIETEAL